MNDTEQVLLTEGDNYIDELDRVVSVKASEYVAKAYEKYKQAGLSGEDAWKRIVERSKWAKTTLEPYKPDELKNPFRVHARHARAEKKVLVVTTESGQMIHTEDVHSEDLRTEKLNTTSDVQSDLVKLANQCATLERERDKAMVEANELRSQLLVKDEMEKHLESDTDLKEKLESAEMEISFLKENATENFIKLKSKGGKNEFYYADRVGIKPLRKHLDEFEKKGIKVFQIYMQAIS